VCVARDNPQSWNGTGPLNPSACSKFAPKCGAGHRLEIFFHDLSPRVPGEMTGETHSAMLDGYTAADLEAIARTMRAAQDSAQQLQPITSNLPTFNVASAYAVANLLHETRLQEGARPVGRKLGFTNPDILRYRCIATTSLKSPGPDPTCLAAPWRLLCI
jgi:hypothetical protein